ncbi:MAG: alkaline phosphatase [Saprospiraceae bacterium]|jgi:alkaline phosphatase
MKRISYLFLALFFFSCDIDTLDTPSAQYEGMSVFANYKDPVFARKPKNIILLIGDGMGISQITAGLYMNGNKLNLERFPIIGLHKTYSGSHLVTDSAAGATALACGIKTYNGAVGVNMDTLPVRNILEIAEAKGMATGLIATSTVVHATPAAFIAHQKHREMYEEIAADFLKTEIDFFVGGGKKYFDRRSTDDRNLYSEMQENGYVVSDYYQNELINCELSWNKNFAYFTADNDPLPVSQGRDYLYAASKMGMAFLTRHSQEGFFLMIEGSQIDWGGHTNDSDYLISEVLDFDRTIGSALDFAAKNNETLVIVTADHETGGYSILKDSKMDDHLVTAFTTDYHTADLIPVFAFGPGAEAFSGIYENTAIFKKIKKALER